MGETSHDRASEEELDPELLKLPRPSTRIRPIMALAVIAICLTIGLRLAGDLRFSRHNEAIVMPSAQALLSAASNQLVEVSLTLDNPQALRIIPSRSTSGEVLVPVLGSQGSVWVLLAPTAWQAKGATDTVYRGRVSRLADMKFYEPLRRHLAQGTVALRPILLEQARTALAASARDVADVSGDRYPVQPTTNVQIQEVATDRAQVVAVATDQYTDEASWNLALQTANVLPLGATPVSGTLSSWTYHVPAPKGAADIQERLRNSDLFAADASEIRRLREGTWSELGLDGKDIILRQASPGYRTTDLAIAAPPLLASGAVLLDTNETPGAYWYVSLIVLLLSVIALIFAAAITQRIRRGA